MDCCSETPHEKTFTYSKFEGKLPFVTSISNDGQLGVAVYSAPDGIILSVNKKFAGFSRLYERIYSFGGGKLKYLIDEFCDFSMNKAFLEVLDTGKISYIRDAKYEAIDGGGIYLTSLFVPVFIEGVMKYIVHIAADVSNIVKNLDIISKQNKQLQVIIENMSDEFVIFNKDCECIAVNKTAENNSIFGYKKSVMLEKIYQEAYDKNNVEVYDVLGNFIELENMPYRKVLAGNKIINSRYIVKSNYGIAYKEVNGLPLYDSDGEFIAGILIFKNIDETLKYEEKLYISAQYDTINTIIENLDLGFARFTYPKLNYIDLNNQAYELLKKLNPQVGSKLSLKGQNILDTGYGELHLAQKIKSYKKNEGSNCFEIIKFNVCGDDLFYKFIYQPLYGLSNDIIEIVLISINITEEIRAKEKMKTAIRMQDNLYTSVAHELKTPVNVIFSANQMVDMFLKKDSIEGCKEKFVNYNNSIKQNCYRLIKLINNIVDLSKSKTGFLKMNLSNENIVEVVKSIVDSVSEYVKTKNLKIIFQTNTNEKIVACDPIMIERVVLNLISNAIKFSNPDSSIFININADKNHVEISVRDTGVGIDKKNLNQLFQKYYQVDKTLSRNTEGCGIGLYLTKAIVEMHGGEVRVESEVGKGSIFTIELPVTLIKDKNKNGRFENVSTRIDMVNIEFSDIYNLNGE